MATNKMIPRRLVSDTDEKLLKPTDMVDALNITVSEDGEGTGGVVKNARGNSGVYYESDTDTFTVGQPDLVPGAKVIGQVADPARGFIYFFVKGGQADRNSDGIYQIILNGDQIPGLWMVQILDDNGQPISEAWGQHLGGECLNGAQELKTDWQRALLVGE